ncbi:RidA family protein [Salipaludibacillus agaradhaerens]|uniref:RidA family protein n=1 Tax=Salipaludibacillus agaradhaerens TaxID=76935 RepID=UPI002150DC45|nr:RidA family protein [Salipaludibacillus agaradhaerens]MCR6106894.1 RidA family protein [Salipaludibacillus agaradhaerens]MCR6118926.1 RidA family protein [Salipaludibacillus agaradhaerens]
MQKMIRKNPRIMPKPVGNYSHITRVPKGAGLIVTSGQVGTDMDGNIPSNLNDQVTNTFANMKKVLESEGLTEVNIIKVNIWATEEIDWDYLDAQWDALFGAEYPSMTVAYISALGWPELKIEIELWCAQV